MAGNQESASLGMVFGCPLKCTLRSPVTCVIAFYIPRTLAHHNRSFHSSSSHKSIRIIPLIKLSDMFCVSVSPHISSCGINCGSTNTNLITTAHNFFLCVSLKDIAVIIYIILTARQDSEDETWLRSDYNQYFSKGGFLI